jgi:hypothetical protein
MLLAAVFFIVGVLGWILLRRTRGSSDPAALASLQREALSRLATANGLRIEQDVAHGEIDGFAFRVETGTRGFLFDGDVVLSASCASDVRLVVWPRDPPDDAIAGLGKERASGDEPFDARFATFASSPEVMEVLDVELRDSLYELVTAAIFVRNREAVLLLPGVPSDRALVTSVQLLGRFAKRCAKLGAA